MLPPDTMRLVKAPGFAHQIVERVKDAHDVRILACRHAILSFRMHQHRCVRLKQQHMPVRQQTEVDTAVVKIHPLSNICKFSIRPVSNYRSRVFEIGQFLHKLPGMRFHIGREIVHQMPCPGGTW
jgi:hypothetical protein